ncbi:DUF1642 domain-containing protein [Streptococcus salivarius]|uniref:DUF1642 domain-containing protein n=1 Tax=Streptococcus salivarius TaxID=1304 RepID=UPI0012BCB374|nr:DUF1642 domain-containing protein [Streptococcus salivarius]MTR26010.1 DUF1642 domain-containing protein [Streptococcus salivarius]
MDRQEAVQKLATAGRLSIAHAEDLYDSFFLKPVVPQCVADWYEEHKNDLNDDIWAYLTSWADTKWDEFKYWMYHTGRNKAITTLVNMHQFGYEVEKEARYTVRIKGRLGQYLGKYYLNNEELTPQFIRTLKGEGSVFTRTELEDAGFGWIFSCEGIEVEEVE